MNESIKRKGFIECFVNGIIFENPTFVLMLGMCPTLAVTTSLSNAIGMGLSTTAVLVTSNFIISLLRKVIPGRVRIPSYIVIVATLVTIVQLLLEAYFPNLYESLGIYIPLIVVNCIILGRAEAFASKNNIIDSIGDGIGMGLGFTMAISCIAIVRELFGSGDVFGYSIIPDSFNISIFVLAPGAFFVLAFLCAIQNKLNIRKSVGGKTVGCNLDCKTCEICINKEKASGNTKEVAAQDAKEEK
jgi:electron transport complex protein RnfE